MYSMRQVADLPAPKIKIFFINTFLSGIYRKESIALAPEFFRVPKARKGKKNMVVN